MRTTRFSDAVPQVLGDAVRVEVLLEVNRDTLQELLLANVVRQHPKHWTNALEYSSTAQRLNSIVRA